MIAPMSDAIGAAAATWGVLMALSPVLQMRRMLERRSSADVSLAYLGVLQIGFALWIGYGLALANAALIVPNSVAFLIGVATIGVAVRYRSGRPAPSEEAEQTAGED
jgi:MtN3 and saliva related transmembrane protein